jgi:hypothetical protein
MPLAGTFSAPLEVAMRASGAANEKVLLYVPVAVAVICLVLVMGGPSEVLRTLELALSRFLLTARDYMSSRI